MGGDTTSDTSVPPFDGSKATEGNLNSRSQGRGSPCNLVSGFSGPEGISQGYVVNVETRGVGVLGNRISEVGFVSNGEGNLREEVGLRKEESLVGQVMSGECRATEVEGDEKTREKQEGLLEAKKKQLLAQLEGGSLLKDKSFCEEIDDASSPSPGGGGMLGGLQGINESVIDGKISKEGEGAGKKGKAPRRRKKHGKEDYETSGREKKDDQIAQVRKQPMQVSAGGNVGLEEGDVMKIKYSRAWMEKLRFVNMVEQRKFWRGVYTGLEGSVLKAYDDLASSKHQKNIPCNFSQSQRNGRKGDGVGIIVSGQTCSENVDLELPMEEEDVVNVNQLDAGSSQSTGGKVALSSFSEQTCSENVGLVLPMEEEDIVNVNQLDAGSSHSTGGKVAYMCSEGEYSEEKDSDDDYASIQKPAFFVDGEPDFESGSPENGLEYLRRVRWEAAHIPKVKVAMLDKSKVKKEQSVYMPQIPEIAKCPEHFLPLKQWEDAFLDEFSNLQLVLSRDEDTSTTVSCKLKQMVTENNSNPSLVETIIPQNLINLKTDEFHSHNSLGGSSQEMPNDLQSTADAEDDKSLTSCQNLTPRSSGDHNTTSYPTLSAIMAMDSVARTSMLRKRISLAETMSTLSKDDCVWLFSLCAAVDTPLDAGTCAALRSLLRKCASLRAVKCELDDEVVMLNILATIAGRYFGQSES